MKKLKKFIKSNVKTGVAFIIGLVLAGGSAAVVYAISGSQVTYTDTNNIGATNVQDAIDKLYEKAANAGGSSIGLKSGDYNPSSCTASTLNLGDYVRITPALTSYYVTGSYTGINNNTYSVSLGCANLWRVIKKNSCNVEVVSEYAVNSYGNSGIIPGSLNGTSDHYRFYQDYVGLLNMIAKAFENPNYTIGSRAMGFDGQIEFIPDSKRMDTSYSDSNYTSDLTLVEDVYKSDTSTYGTSGLKTQTVYSGVYGGCSYSDSGYFIASRYVKYEYSRNQYNIRTVTSDGDFGSTRMFNANSVGWGIDNYNNIRPILVLRPELTVESGSGTKASPYVFN